MKWILVPSLYTSPLSLFLFFFSSRLLTSLPSYSAQHKSTCILIPLYIFVHGQSCLTLRLHGLQPTRLFCPWNFPSKITGADCHFLLQRIFPTKGLNPYLLHLLHWQTDSLPAKPLEKPILIPDYKLNSYKVNHQLLHINFQPLGGCPSTLLRFP